MISVEEALSLVLSHAAPAPAARLPVAEAMGLVLAETVVSDIDSPPHDKAMMDGYAVRSADLQSGEAVLTVLEEITAGDTPSKTIESGTASRIMTGAPVPAGADAVVMIERTELIESADGLPRVRINDSPPAGKNIMPRGESLRRGDPVLHPGHIIRPIEAGVLAEVGRMEIAVHARPRAAVLATGNELVAPQETPGAGQIRNSNSPLLGALAAQAGAAAIDLGAARDDEADLRRLIGRGLESDLLLLSGGVSAGVLDLAPKVLAQLGVEPVFHKVKIKPGKPLWFGVKQSRERKCLVFGLPGNPVSGFACFEVFVRPALRRLAGYGEPARPRLSATLTSEYQHRGDRPTFFPARFWEEASARRAAPLPWRGSADLRTLADANAFLCFPAGERRYWAGDEVDILPLE